MCQLNLPVDTLEADYYFSGAIPAHILTSPK